MIVNLNLTLDYIALLGDLPQKNYPGSMTFGSELRK